MVQPIYSAQIGDRVKIIDENTNINADYIIIGLVHTLLADLRAAQAQTEITLFRVV
jgi:hypothetical protein